MQTKSPAIEARIRVAVVGEGLDQGGNVVRVARHDLEEAVVARNQRLVVDATRVGLAEPQLAALGDKALGAVEVAVVLLLHLVSGRGAVQDHGGALERFTRLVADLVTQRLEGGFLMAVDRELRAARIK